MVPSRLSRVLDSLMNVSCLRNPFRSVSVPPEWAEVTRTMSSRLAGGTRFAVIWLFGLLTLVGWLVTNGDMALVCLELCMNGIRTGDFCVLCTVDFCS